MAKFKDLSIDLETGEHIDFDDADTIMMGYDGEELYLTSTLSGARAVQPYHMVRYDQLTEVSGILSDHGNLNGLEDDDHQQYILADGTRELTGDWVTGSGIQVPWIQFETNLPEVPIHSEGLLHWNPNDGTLDIDMPGGEVHLQIGQEQVIRATNKTGSLISNGTVVYIDGAQGNRPTINLAAANSFNTTKVIGFATEDIADNASGYVTTDGLVRDVDTSGITAGSRIYLSPTVSGTFQDDRPIAPNFKVCLGYVIVENAEAGVVLVDVTVTPKLAQLSDVFEEVAQDGEYLAWSSTASRFELAAPAQASGIDHGDLLGLEDDDHFYYVPTDGSRGFTSTVSGVAATEPDHLVTYEQLQDTEEGLQLADGVVLLIDYVEDDALSSTTSNVYQDKCSITVPATISGTIRVMWSLEYNASANNKDVWVRAYNVTDGIILGENNQQTNNNLNWWTFAGFGYVTVSGTVKDFSLQFRAGTANCSVRNAHIEACRIDTTTSG